MEKQAENQQQELRSLFHMLEHTAQIAEEATLTETFGDGEPRCITQFNNVLARLRNLSAIPDGLFDELQTDACFGQIGIACHQLAAYLNEELETTPDFKGWVTSFFGKRVMENLTEELAGKPLADMIRKAVPDFLTETTLEDIVKTFPAAAPGTLTIDADFGEIDIHSTTEEVLTVRVHRAAQLGADRRAGEILDNFDVQITNEGTDIKIEAKFSGPAKQWQKLTPRLDIQFDIVVPRHYTLNLKTMGEDISVVNIDGGVNAQTIGGGLRFQNINGPLNGTTSDGDIDLKSFNGDVVLRTRGGTIALATGTGAVDMKTTGDIHVSDVTGTVTAETTSGSIELVDCSGGADVQTASGKITLMNVAPDVNAKSTSGPIRAAITTQPRHNYTLHSPQGAIAIVLNPNIAIDLDAYTRNGDISTDLPVTTVIQGKVTKNRLKGSINAGGPMLKLQTATGDIRLKSTGK